MQIVHRDISPSNIFISKRGDVKLGDFGIAHAQRRESKTQVGTLKGKYGYMSPEQVVGPADRRAQRSVRGRRGAGRAAHRATAVLRARRSRRAAEGARRAARSARQVRRRSAHRARSHRAPGAEEGPARATRRPRPSCAMSWRTTCSRRAAGRAERPAHVHAARCFDTSPDAAARRPAGGAPDGEAHAGAEAAAADGDGAARRRASERPIRRAPGADGSGRGHRGDAAGADVKTVTHRTPAARSGGHAQATAVVDEPWHEHDERALVGAPVHAGVASGRRARAIARADRGSGRPVTTTSDVGRFVSAAPKRPPDSAGDVSVITPMRLFCDLALAGETGLLHFELARHREGDLPGRRRARVGQLERRQRALRRVPGRAKACSGTPIWSSRSACCRTTTASWATRSWRWGCCARSTCSGCCPSRCATA